ncbi:MAG: Mo-dependent nitrogenase C-terminal domain-containing protein [Nostocaceae cyanobacterium]|nr:Mo-dependent nitrogenase C-terminal domain-containing protein [Nostocaceae cyanobacterium]
MMGSATHSHHNYLPPDKRESGFFDILYPLRQFVNGFQVKNRKLAHLFCQLIPCCCPFERDINLFGRTVHIPALCKLNPLYDEFVGLRLRSLSFLADVCGEDVTKYICD